MGFKQVAIANFFAFNVRSSFLLQVDCYQRELEQINPNSKDDQEHSVYQRIWFVNIALLCREGVVYLLIGIGL